MATFHCCVVFTVLLPAHSRCTSFNTLSVDCHNQGAKGVYVTRTHPSRPHAEAHTLTAPIAKRRKRSLGNHLVTHCAGPQFTIYDNSIQHKAAYISQSAIPTNKQHGGKPLAPPTPPHLSSPSLRSPVFHTPPRSFPSLSHRACPGLGG